MASDASRPQGPTVTSSACADLEVGAYSSPPCFLHELDPSFLGFATAPAAQPQATAADDGTPDLAVARDPDDIPTPDALQPSWILTVDGDVIAPPGTCPDGAPPCRSSAISSPNVGPTASSR